MKWKLNHPYLQEALRGRPEIRIEWCIRVVENSVRSEVQPDGRIRYWGQIQEFGGRYLRVIVLPDRTTLFNAFFDRRYRP